MKVHVDISIFTEDASIGMVSGDLEVPIVPQVGDSMTFDLQRADLDRHQAAFRLGHIKVTHRLIGAGPDGGIIVMLDDVTAKTEEGALQIMAFFEDCHGLYGDRFSDE